MTESTGRELAKLRVKRTKLLRQQHQQEQKLKQLQEQLNQQSKNQ